MRFCFGPLLVLAICAGCQDSESRDSAKKERAPGVGEVAVALPNKPASPEVVGAASPTPPDAASKVFYLNKSPHFYSKTRNGKDEGLLVHEYFRQALLLAAREELGLVTRDAWLGDAIPADGPIRPFEIATRVGGPVRLEVLRGFALAMSAVGSVDMPPYPEADYNKRLFSAAERFSRTSFPQILKRQYGERKPCAWKADVAVPAEIEESLRQMSFLSQFKAVRQLHERMAGQGASPAMLGALVRGYANLGILTESHFHPAHKVFKARAILYAQRWLTREPESVAAQWHRAYALTLTGLHVDAMTDLEAAHKAWQTLPEKGRPSRPGWVPLLDACCHYDVEKLAAELGHAEHGQLASLLHYHTVELAGNKRWALQTGLATLEKIPECYRVHDAVCALGGVSVAHRATLEPFHILGRTLYDQVREMPGLPDAVRQQAKRPGGRSGMAAALFGSRGGDGGVETELAGRARLVAALREASKPQAASAPNAESPAGDRKPAEGETKSASRPADADEPSWAALAQLIQDVSFLHVWRRAYFVRYQYGDSADDLLRQAAPLFADHPLRPFLEGLAWDVTKQQAAFAEVAKRLPDGLEFHAYLLTTGFHTAQPQARDVLFRRMLAYPDDIARDFVVECREFASQPDTLRGFAKNLLEVSPHSPLARAFLLDCDVATKVQVAEWEKAADKYPALAHSLACYYGRAKQWDDAIRYNQMAIKMAADKGLYEFAADVYLEKEDEDGWLKSLKAALELPDYGLDHADINRKIAWQFMNKKDWKRALPYAKEAAGSYSGWGLECAAYCYEGLHDLEQAEKYYRATSTRYRSSALAWYYFCRRTGKGDLDAARELAAQYVDGPLTLETGEARFDAAAFYILEKQPKKAWDIYRETFRKQADPFFGLWVAILADELKDANACEAALERIRIKGPTYVRKDVGRPRTELVQLAAWIKRDLAQGGKGQIDLDAVEKLLAPVKDSNESQYVDMFLARYLKTHGKREEAIRYYRKGLACTDLTAFARNLAGAALSELGIAPDDHKELPQPQDLKKDAKTSPDVKKSPKAEAKSAAGQDGAKDARKPAEKGRRQETESAKPGKDAEKKAEPKQPKS